MRVWHYLIWAAAGIFVAVRVFGATGSDKIVYDVLAGVGVIAFVLYINLSSKLDEVIKLLRHRE